MSGRFFFNICNMMIAILVLRMSLSCLLLLGLLRTFCHRLRRLVQTKKNLIGNVPFHGDRDAPCHIVWTPEG
ncbi:hypothetical protein EDD18DRAFT_1207823 [Armillaria luteobubalina]|uniref:Uncharacterized protein n=1 Tax=Armillaria luteobubalina TaxID=153913 RepID=A0AA39P8J6_9AGAR|nr:hypothetical protein EDD18DRAFT_1207823 [Armillaria luteobubalina]